MSEADYGKKNIGLLSSNFAKTVSEGYFVDKSYLLKDMIDAGSEVTLITRPRRFGKSLNLSMIQTFFEKTEKNNSVYFKNLKIWDCGEKYRAEQGKYPVICLNCKAITGDDWDVMYGVIKDVISEEYKRHPELKGNVDEDDLEKYDNLKKCRGTYEQYIDSLRFLCKLLNMHHGVKPVVLLDEYDHPIQEAVDGKFYDKAIKFFKPFFSNVLKDNTDLSFAVVMGITRVSKEGIFSGLNNLKVCSVLTDEYSQYFGFTDEEVDRILADYDCLEKKTEVSDWYNGYRFGTSRTQIYNPWSVLNYIIDGCKPKAYWVNTSGNGLIGGIMFDPNAKIRAGLTKLMEGGSISCKVDENITYKDLQVGSNHIYSLLLMSGYLMCVSSEEKICELTIPNKEVREVYATEICERLCLSDDMSSGQSVSTAIKNRDAKLFRSALSYYIATSVNFSLLKKEYAYEILTLGILADLDNVYYIMSEEKLPRTQSDQVLVPKEKYRDFLPAVVFEYERCNKVKELEARALSGRKQIDEKEYDVKLKAFGFTDIYKLGVAFCGSHVVVKTEYTE